MLLVFFKRVGMLNTGFVLTASKSRPLGSHDLVGWVTAEYVVLARASRASEAIVHACTITQGDSLVSLTGSEESASSRLPKLQSHNHQLHVVAGGPGGCWAQDGGSHRTRAMKDVAPRQGQGIGACTQRCQ